MIRFFACVVVLVVSGCGGSPPDPERADPIPGEEASPRARQDQPGATDEEANTGETGEVDWSNHRVGGEPVRLPISEEVFVDAIPGGARYDGELVFLDLRTPEGRALLGEARGPVALRIDASLLEDDDTISTVASLSARIPVGLRIAENADALLGGLPFIASISALDLRKSEVSQEGLQHLSEAAQLRVLDLDETTIGDDALVHLAGLRALRSLTLRWTNTTDAGMDHLRGLTQLRTLGLSESGVGDAGLAFLPTLTGLTHLDVGIGATDVTLARLPMLRRLQSLIVGGRGITDAGLAHLAGLTELRTLVLSMTAVGDAGMAHLADLAKLETLHLMSTQVGDAGVRHLARLEALETLNLHGTQVTDDCLGTLVELPRLSMVNIAQTQTTPAGRDLMRRVALSRVEL